MMTSSGSNRELKAAKKGLLTGYMKSVDSKGSRKQYFTKLSYINNLDPCEIPRNKWADDIELCRSVSYMHVGMYLLFSPKPIESRAANEKV